MIKMSINKLSALSMLAIAGCNTGENGTASVQYGTVKGHNEMIATSGTRKISGVYPHLTTYAQSSKGGLFNKNGHNECGIGAIIPWADKLWMITYAPHMPLGSEHKLYSIDKNMNMTIHSESVGGTPAARMIHCESNQLFIGHYAIDKSGKIRVIDPKKMPGRITAIMRHLTDPENYIYIFDMENMFYEVNVHTLKFKKLFHDPIPGYHGKGGYTSQGKVVVSNNGEISSTGGLDNHKDWKVSKKFLKKGPEDRGCLATFDGKNWEVIERRQYTEVTGPQGVSPSESGKDLPLWSIGWDKRSLRLQVMDKGLFSTFLLPKACLNNDAKHGWFTEWPRIRDINEKDLMMDMHGMFFKFPKNFTPSNCAGIEPIASHLRYIPDFCFWNGQLVLVTDEASIQGNPLTGQPQSNLWFGDFDDLKNWGPRSAIGSIYMNDQIKANTPSDPFLINGFARRIVFLDSDKEANYTLQIDIKGDGIFVDYKTIRVKGLTSYIFPKEFNAQWIRVKSDKDCKATISFHLTDDTYRDAAESKNLFKAIADINDTDVTSALLFSAKRNRNLRVINGSKNFDFTQFDFEFMPTKADKKLAKNLEVRPEFSVDAASVILISHEDRSIVDKKGHRTVLRLPKGSPGYDTAFNSGQPRMHREIESERLMANIHGTFYEVPFWIVGEPPVYTKMRPVTTHNKQIIDFATWNGLLAISGLKANAEKSNHVYKTEDGKTSLWFGSVDDLWKLGKPVGVGGPWKNTSVKAGVVSDPYLMTGYDKKTLELTADKDCSITLEVDIDHWTGFHKYKSFKVKAGKKLTYKFPEAFSAHWVRVKSDKNCTATAWFIYE